MIRLFISSIAIYQSLGHPHPGWIYVGTPAPTIPGQTPIITDPTNPNTPPLYPPPMVHNYPPGVNVPTDPNGNPLPPVIIPPQTPNTTPPNVVPPETPVITPPGPATGQGPPEIVPPVTTAQPANPGPGSGPPEIVPPVTNPANPATTTTAPLVVTTGLPSGVNTLTTTAQPVPGIGPPPAVGPPPGPPFFPGFFETTSTNQVPVGPPPASIPNPNPTLPNGQTFPPLPIVTTNPVPPLVVPPAPVPITPGSPGWGTGVTPQPTPFPTNRPTTTAAPTTPYPTMPTPAPTTRSPTPFPTNRPTTPAPVPPLPGHIYGAYMQNCPEPLGTEQCEQTDQFVTDQTGSNAIAGQVTCNAANDCCMCRGIQCGEVGGTSCTSLVLSGEKAAYGVLDINVIVDAVAGAPATIACSGLESCKEAALRGNYISAMRCSGRFGCQTSEIIINNPAPGFTLECGVTSACENAKITLNFLPPTSGTCDPATMTDILLGAISCIGVNGCKGMELTINNMGCDNVIIESIECRLDTCAEAQFNFYGTSAIGIQACELPATGAQPLGIERCFSQLRSLSCPDPGSCMNQKRTLTDPINGFILDCASDMSCLNADYTVQITPAEYATPTQELAVQCNAMQACQGANFHFTSDNVIPLNVEFFCNAERSCAGTTITTGTNVLLSDIECGSIELCMGCTLNGIPCGGHYSGLYTPPNFPAINVPPNPNPSFPVIPTFPSPPNPAIPTFPAPPNPAVPTFPNNPNPAVPVFPQPNNPVPPSPPLVDPWSQPNPWAAPSIPSGPTFSGNSPYPPYPTFTNPGVQPLPPPIIPPNPVSIPIVPSPPTIPTQPQNPNPAVPNPSIPTFNGPSNPQQPQIPPPIPPNPNQNFNPAPVDPWLQPNPWQAPPPVIDPWAAPNPYFSPMPPMAPMNPSNPLPPPPVNPSNPGSIPPPPPPPMNPVNPGPWFPQQPNYPPPQQGGPTFAFNPPPVFPQQQQPAGPI